MKSLLHCKSHTAHSFQVSENKYSKRWSNKKILSIFNPHQSEILHSALNNHKKMSNIYTGYVNKLKCTFFVYLFFFFTLPWFILQYLVPKLRLCKVQFVLEDYLECLQLFKYNLLNYFETKWCVELKKVQHLNCCHVLISLQTALTAEDGISFVQGAWCSNRSHWF